jgi:hypothetical protein
MYRELLPLRRALGAGLKANLSPAVHSLASGPANDQPPVQFTPFPLA